MRAPDHQRARRPDDVHEARGLGIVQKHHVSGIDERQDLSGVTGDRGLVAFVLGGAEPPTVSGEAVETVVEALGQGEERLVAFDHQPSRVDARAARIGQ